MESTYDVTKQQESILSKSVQIDKGIKNVTGKIIAPHGTPLYWTLSYNKGGMNYFTDREEPREFEANFQRLRRGFMAFTDLNDPEGAIRMGLFSVDRYSKKQAKNALKILSEKITEVFDEYPDL